jgi:hypothetical protein
LHKAAEKQPVVVELTLFCGIYFRDDCSQSSHHETWLQKMRQHLTNDCQENSSVGIWNTVSSQAWILSSHFFLSCGETGKQQQEGFAPMDLFHKR